MSGNDKGQFSLTITIQPSPELYERNGERVLKIAFKDYISRWLHKGLKDISPDSFIFDIEEVK